MATCRDSLTGEVDALLIDAPAQVGAIRAVGYVFTDEANGAVARVSGIGAIGSVVDDNVLGISWLGTVFATTQVEPIVPIGASCFSIYAVGGVITSVRAQHETSYSFSLAASHSAYWGSSVSQTLTALWGSLSTIGSSLSCLYNIEEYQSVANSHRAEYGVLLASRHVSLFGDLHTVAVSSSCVYGDLQILRKSHKALFGDAVKVATQHKAIFTARSSVSAYSLMRYGDVIPVSAYCKSTYDLDVYNRVYASFTSFWSMSSGELVFVDNSVSVQVLGTAIDVGDLVINQSEGEASYSLEAEIVNPEHYMLFRDGTEIIVDLVGEVYTFFCTGKSLSRSSQASIDMRVEGKSECAFLDTPRGSTISMSFGELIDIQEAIEALLGRSVTWEFLHFDVKPYRIAVEDGYPLSVVSGLLEEIGAILQSEPDGSLIVRRKYVQEPLSIDQTNAVHVYSDADDNLSASESYEARDGFNKFRVTESDSQYSDVIEFVADEDSNVSGVLKVYPSPYRLNVQVRSTTVSPAILLDNGTWVDREETEKVEFVNGETSTRYPIHQLLQVDWISTSLTGVAFDNYSSTLTANSNINDGYGLATVRYTTKSLDYRTSAPVDSSVQYVVGET